MNNIWEILEITPTTDQRAIRSAYSTQSKKYHPEENPEGFQRLHMAYQEALLYASGNRAGTEPLEEFAGNSEFQERETGNVLFDRDIQKETLAGKESGFFPEYIEDSNTGKKKDVKIENDIREDTEDEEDTKTEKNTEEEEVLENSTSFLERLIRAEEREVAESMQFGALKQFIAILEDPKRFRKADVWKEFFLSEEFLKEQFSEVFADGMFRYLSDWESDGNFNIDQMPGGFLLELAVAYVLAIDPFGKDKPALSDGFYARKVASSIWERQQGGRPIRILLKPENRVRMRSFSDYIRLRTMNEENLLTIGNKENWEKMVRGGYSGCLYELEGKKTNTILYETRSTCLIDLYTFWIRNDTVPGCVLECMYQEYCLRNVEHTSVRKVYAGLKQAIISRYPDIEHVLYGEQGKAEMISSWYRELMQIISDNEASCGQTGGMEGRLDALFARPEWPKIRYSPELFEKMFHRLHSRAVMPTALTERLLEFYSEEAGITAGAWTHEKGNAMMEGLVHSLYYNRRIARTYNAINGTAGSELVSREAFEASGAGKIDDCNADFWHYFLLRGFGCRRVDVTGKEDEKKYAGGNRDCLPAYIDNTYQPVECWQKLFTCHDKEDAPPAVEFTLPDQKKLKVEFYLHYVLYYLDGQHVFLPQYSFQTCLKFARSFTEASQFFFLLAITSIGNKDYREAVEVIGQWLARLPLHPVTVPVVAKLLAGSRWKDWEEEGEVYAVYYTEQEDNCFRAIVCKEGFLVYHQIKFGWEHFHTVRFETEETLDIENKKRKAKDFLRDMRRPKPVCLDKIDLSGMENAKKAVHIIEALKRQETFRRRETGLAPYFPGYPWKKKAVNDTGLSDHMDALDRFFRTDGGFLTESYCVLCYEQENRKEVFYCSMLPFGFRLSLRNADWPSTYQFETKELQGKVRTKHWIVGHFGWGGTAGPDGERATPKIFAVSGEGEFLHYDVIRMKRDSSLAGLLAKVFDFSKVAAVELYQGYLSISRLNGTLEYCYGKEDFFRSVYTPTITAADLFTTFTKAEMMDAFAEFMDRWVSGTPEVSTIVYFHFEYLEGNVYSMYVYNKNQWEYTKIRKESNGTKAADIPEVIKKEDGTQAADIQEKIDEKTDDIFSCLSKEGPFVWKLWRKEKIFSAVFEDFNDILYWYMDFGIYGKRLKDCWEIRVSFSVEEGKLPMVSTIYNNEKMFFKFLKERRNWKPGPYLPPQEGIWIFDPE